MSASGQKQIFAAQKGMSALLSIATAKASQTVMSALHPEADLCGALAHVCFGPEADMPRFKSSFRETSSRRARRFYSTLRPSFFTRSPHFFSSRSMSAAYSAGVDVSGSPPSSWIRVFTSGVSISLRSSSLSLSTISFGVPAGANVAQLRSRAGPIRRRLARLAAARSAFCW
jgi:hypothetical protein